VSWQQIRYTLASGTATVLVDTNGDAAADLQIRLDHVSTLHATAFLL
jgi:hypothetical protein